METDFLSPTTMTGLIHPNHGPVPGNESGIHDEFRAFILDGNHPCVGASAALRRDEYWLGAYEELGSAGASRVLARDLYQYLKTQENEPRSFASFLAVFKEPRHMTEEAFESALWKQLTELDRISSIFFDWDSTVDSDPGSSKFSFSFGGRAFYVVGLHPNSSRQARSFRYPTLVFNLHSQFEALRESGKYDRMRDTIRSRDEKLQGSINPMLRDFGDASEARQYSGRAVDSSWKCPFHAARDLASDKKGTH